MLVGLSIDVGFLVFARLFLLDFLFSNFLKSFRSRDRDTSCPIYESNHARPRLSFHVVSVLVLSDVTERVFHVHMSNLEY